MLGAAKVRPKKIQNAYQIRVLTDAAREVRDYVTDLLVYLESEIESAIVDKKNKVIVPLSTRFPVTGMRADDSRDQVYYYLLRSLEGANYRVKLDIDNEKIPATCRLYLTWIDKAEEQRRQEMRNYIANHTLKEQKLTPAEAPTRPRVLRRRK